MKHFIYTLELKNAKYGYNVTNNVYQIIKGRPKHIGTANYNTQSYRGHDHEAVQILVDEKVLPKNVMDKPNHGYMVYHKLNTVYTLDKI